MTQTHHESGTDTKTQQRKNNYDTKAHTQNGNDTNRSRE